MSKNVTLPMPVPDFVIAVGHYSKQLKNFGDSVDFMVVVFWWWCLCVECELIVSCI